MLCRERPSILIHLTHSQRPQPKIHFCCLSCSARQSVPILEYKKNLGLIVDRLQKLGAAVILITPPPVDEQARVKLALQVRAAAEHHQLPLFGSKSLLVSAL